MVKVTDGLHNQNMTVLSSFLLWFDQLGFMVEHYKPKSGRKVMDCCVQGQGHSKGSVFQLMFALISVLFLNSKACWRVPQREAGDVRCLPPV